MCHHTWEPTVMSGVSCRPSHLNVDRFHQPCLSPGRIPVLSDPRTTYPRGQPSFSSLPLTGGFCHADWTVPRQDVKSPFSLRCHTQCKGVCTHASSGPSRERRRLLNPCLGDPIPLAKFTLKFNHNFLNPFQDCPKL